MQKHHKISHNCINTLISPKLLTKHISQSDIGSFLNSAKHSHTKWNQSCKIHKHDQIKFKQTRSKRNTHEDKHTDTLIPISKPDTETIMMMIIQLLTELAIIIWSFENGISNSNYRSSGSWNTRAEICHRIYLREGSSEMQEPWFGIEIRNALQNRAPLSPVLKAWSVLCTSHLRVFKDFVY